MYMLGNVEICENRDLFSLRAASANNACNANKIWTSGELLVSKLDHC